MAINAREILNDFLNGVGKISQMDSAFVDSFMSFGGAAGKPLDAKTIELIGVAIGVYNRCQYCICVHTHDAYKAGAAREEILAAAEVAVTFGGGPSMAYSAAVLNAALDEFEHDFD